MPKSRGSKQDYDRHFHILLAEDDAELRKLLSWSLRVEGYEVTECPDGLSLLSHLHNYLTADTDPDFQLIVSDIQMPGLTGLEVLEMAMLLERFPPMVLITAFGDEQTHAQAARLGVTAFLDKPFEIEKLVATVRMVAPIPVSVTTGS